MSTLSRIPLPPAAGGLFAPYVPASLTHRDLVPNLIDSRTLAFQLYDVFDAGALCQRPRFSDYSREAFDAVLSSARGIAADLYATHQKLNDTDEPSVVNGNVVLNPGVKPAYDATAEAGLLAASQDAELGGMQLPHLISIAAYALLDSANAATASYSLLTVGAANLIAAFGSQEQKDTWLPPMFAGKFGGTMALTEPDAGSSLADLRCSAAPQPDGTYHMGGTKIWISGGDHELTQNIVHLVLARIEGAPPGTKGISLFIVPKFLLNADGTLGARNGVVLGGLIHKMGWRGTCSTLLNFGETAPCVAYLVGEPHKGLTYMFHMMNEARIAVGRAATGMGHTAYNHAVAYARTRRQGRLPSNKDPLSPPVSIIEHADVRRMLLEALANVDGALALILECGRLLDDEQTAPSAADRQQASALLEVLTPLAKTFPALGCQTAISNAMQVMGGYGYAREYPIEQLYRDNRLNQIHEGTNGIQALDLLGRKVVQQGGASFKALMARIRTTLAAAAETPLAPYAGQLETALGQWAECTRVLGIAMATDPNLALANANVYMDVSNRVVIAWVWLRMGLTADGRRRTAVNEEERDFFEGKLAAMRYWFAFELPRIGPDIALLSRLEATTLEANPAWF
ncbi:MAG: acyl-CoA dehydrogenase [Gemmatimonas sp.]|nr:acyl-CoA dehydrogenase [Gemmatimonas sp.]